MGDIAKAIINSPPALLVCLGLVVVFLAILGQSPFRSVRFKLGRIQRILVAVIGLAVASAGFILLSKTQEPTPAPVVTNKPSEDKPAHFAIGGKVIEKASGAPVADAEVDAYNDATRDEPSNKARSDDDGAFYLNYGKDDEGRYVRLKCSKGNFAAVTHNALITSGNVTLTFSMARTGATSPAPTNTDRGGRSLKPHWISRLCAPGS